MSDVPFTVYFDFEKTTGNAVFFDPKMYVLSYCQIYAFHPSLGLEKIVIFRSFQTSEVEIYDPSRFQQEHVFFFDRTTLFN